MVIARLIKEKLSSTPAGVVLTTRDFGVEMRYQPALAKALNRLVLQGELQKISLILFNWVGGIVILKM